MSRRTSEYMGNQPSKWDFTLQNNIKQRYELDCNENLDISVSGLNLDVYIQLINIRSELVTVVRLSEKFLYIMDFSWS